ncbi:MAG TPA: Glu/Leu/Phe/Val dehydrogenase dimerization domain-containing protein [Afifellaceae bacterium]|nr:Glu/Leu/Phe/Val dehydrogenase dimerization domain-containing protein [Afifellaceae bacterium]
MLETLDSTTLTGHAGYKDHEQIVALSDETAGLHGFIAIHDTTLGPALGGCRMWNYADEAAALTDVLRLSAGMTAKNALANLDFGGGKTVIIGDSHTDKTPELFRALGRAIETLGGRYITGEDVGVTTTDMDFTAHTTAHVRGISTAGIGDPSPFTALGVFHGILSAISHRFGAVSLAGLTVSLQGLGSVGFRLAERLHNAGAQLVVSDIDQAAVARAVEAFGATPVAPERAHCAQADIFSPCALGGGLNARTIPEIRAAIVAGAANNQLDSAADADRLHRRNILYAPDFAINAGGVIAIALGLPGVSERPIVEKTEAIGATLRAIFARSRAENRATAHIADQLANERVIAARARSAA